MARVKRAANLLRANDYYRAHVFAAGLQRHGFVVEPRWARNPTPDDLVLMWNRCRSNEPIAELYERAGAKVLVAENGFTSPVGGGKHYALFLGSHNGAGDWHVGDGARHPIPERPWRERGDYVLVLPQRGIGELGVAMPSAWVKGVLERLGKITDRPIKLRPHPGHSKNGERDTLPEDLAAAHCAVTWGSGSAIKALQAGVPVFYEFERWIGAPGSGRLDRSVEHCHMPDRGELWRRISWAQWLLPEVQSGEAFDGLLNAARGDLFCASQQSLTDHRQGDVRGSAQGRSPCGDALLA